MINKISILSVSLAFIFSLFCSQIVSAQNVGSLQSVVTPGFSFRKDLQLGDTDPDVKELQRVLNADVDTMIMTDEIGSRGKESTYFGPLTKEAVIRFQNKYKDIVLTLNSITVADGKVNKATRTRLNLLIGVINTYDSVGLPQSRGSGSGVRPVTPVVVIPPVVAPAQNQISMSICQFINVLSGINVITATRASQARASFNCESDNNDDDDDVARPTVTIKANGERDSVDVTANTYVTISWTSSRADYCSTSAGRKATSGSQRVLVSTSGIFEISCTGDGGTDSDSVTVIVDGEDVDDEADDDQNDFDYTPPVFDPLATQKVLSLSGSSTDMVYVRSSDSLKTNNKMTIEAWVKPTKWLTKNGLNGTKDQVIVSRGKIGGNMDYALTLDNGKLVYTNNDSALWSCSTSTIPLNQWTHVAVTADETAQDISLYINGVKVTTICEGPRGLAKKEKIDRLKAITNTSASTTDIFIGNYYPKACDPQRRTNGFIGQMDDVRIWNIPRTEADIKNNMTKSVKNATGLVAYLTFDNGLASDVTSFMNGGSLRGGAQVISDSTVTSAVVGSLDYTFGFDFDFEDQCSTKPPEGAAKNQFGGIVTKVSKCEEKPNLTEVVIDPCGGSVTAQINKLGAPGTPNVPVKTLSSQIKINIRDGFQAIPKVGDMVLGNAVDDKGLVCTSLVGGGAVSMAPHVGTVTGQLGAQPDTEGKCKASSSGSAGGSISSLPWQTAGTAVGTAVGVGVCIGTFGAGCIATPAIIGVGALAGNAVGKIIKSFGW